MTQNKMVQLGAGRLRKEWKKSGKKSKWKSFGKVEDIRDFSSIDVYKSGNDARRR